MRASDTKNLVSILETFFKYCLGGTGDTGDPAGVEAGAATSSSIVDILTHSLTWDSFQQMFLWQLIGMD